MGIIIATIILTILMCRLLIKTENQLITVLLTIITITGFICGISLGITLPGTPYEITYQTPIVNLSNGLVSYVCVNTDNSYSYYYEVNSEYKQAENEMAYKQGIVRDNNVTIVEYDKMSDETPTLYIYESGTHGNFWTFNVDTPVGYKYVFRVPRGTVVNQFELNGM